MPSAFYDFGRNMADVIQDLPGQGPTDPDAQATITDFIDYTEFFPSDLFRSLTLIGKLDTSYQEQASRVHRLTKTYGALPTIPSNERPSPQILRKDISFALDQARRYRQATFAEASRLCDTAETLYSRLVGIKRKLINLPKPPSCEPSPVAEPKAQLPERTRKPGLERTPRITLNVDTAHPTGGTGLRIANVPGEKKRRSRRIIVPGEVLPPLDPDSPGVSDTSETDSESPSSPVRLPTVSRPPPKLHRERTPKLPKPGVRIRPPGVMGTNVHSSVAGISVSNAMASLPAPPDNPKPGSTHAPWMELTEWELNGLRKRMKKNADWQPSATMVSRSLAERGRGAENMTKAKAHAEEAGDDFLDERPPEFVRPPVNAIEYKTEVASLESLENRGMKLNQAKKIKRDMMREQAAREHSEHDEFSQRITNIGMAVKKIFETPSYSSLASPTDKKESKTPNRKRKREKSVSAAADQDAETPSEAQSNEPIKPKKLKLTSPAATAHGTTTTTHIPLAQAGPAAPSEASATSPPEVKRSQARSLRTSGASTKATTPAEDLPRQYDSARPGTSGSAVIRPRSSRGTPTISLTFKNGLKAASAEPPSRRISLRRNSDTGASPGVTNRRLAPAVSGVNGRVRGRRPAPGLQINYGDEGGAKVSVGKRKSAPSKRKPANQSTTGKRPSSTAKMELQTNTEDDGDVDPDEPRYCICGDVSFGTMIACENEDCEKEWFHLGCVGLQEIPGRRTKWYCPDCRVKFGAGSDGCVDAGTRRR